MKIDEAKNKQKLIFSVASERNSTGKMGWESRVGAAKMACNASTHFLLKRLLKQLFVGKVFCCFISPPAASEGKRIGEYFKFRRS